MMTPNPTLPSRLGQLEAGGEVGGESCPLPLAPCPIRALGESRGAVDLAVHLTQK
jgi:hypothetical protein